MSAGPQSPCRLPWARRYLLAYLLMGFVSSAACLVFFPLEVALAWLAGFVVDWLPTALMAAIYFSVHGARQIKQIYRRLWQGEIAKLASTALLFYGIIAASSVDLRVVLASFILHKLLFLLVVPCVERWERSER